MHTHTDRHRLRYKGSVKVSWRALATSARYHLLCNPITASLPPHAHQRLYDRRGPSRVPLQPDAAQKRGALQLLDALEARFSSTADRVQMPPQFLEQFAARFEEEGLSPIVEAIGNLPLLAP